MTTYIAKLIPSILSSNGQMPVLIFEMFLIHSGTRLISGTRLFNVKIVTILIKNLIWAHNILIGGWPDYKYSDLTKLIKIVTIFN